MTSTPPQTMTPVRRPIGLAALALVVILLLDLTPGLGFGLLTGALFDALQREFPAPAGGGHVAIIDIDEPSLHRVGQWPWPRDRLARLVDLAGNARAIGIDILLAEPDRLDRAAWLGGGIQPPDTDAALAAAIGRNPVVLAAVGVAHTTDLVTTGPVAPVLERGDDPRRGLAVYSGEVWPLPAFAQAARGIGLINATPEADGVLRHLPALAVVDDVLVPGFDLELMRVASGAQTIRLTSGPFFERRVTVGGTRFRAGPSGGLRPRLPLRSGAPVIPAADLLGGKTDASLFRDRIVLIGSSAAGVAADFMTPVGQEVSALQVHAETIESLATSDLLIRPPLARWLERLLAAGVGGAMLALLARRRAGLSLAVMAAAAVALIAGSLIACRDTGLLVDWTMPLIAWGAVQAVGMAAGLRAEVLARQASDAELARARFLADAETRESDLRAAAEAARLELGITLESAELGVWRLGLADGAFVASGRCAAILGYVTGPGPSTLQALLQQVPEAERDEVAQAFEASAKTGALSTEFRLRGTTGAVRWVGMRGRLVAEVPGEVQYIAGVVSDTTARHQLEERLLQAEKLQAVGLLAGGVAHNFNNLLTVVMGNLELAQQATGRGDAIERPLARALKAVERGAAVTRQLLAFSRRQALQSRPIETKARLGEAIQLLRDAVGTDVRIEAEIPNNLWPLELDPTELDLALLNLALNARDAMKGGGVLRIGAANRVLADHRLGLSGRFVEIDIRDTGSGIAPEVLPHVFEPFVTTKEASVGTGLGLSQVHGFAHQSGGGVELESSLGVGTTVRLYLPARDRARVAVAVPAEEALPPAVGQPTILLVEDDRDVADVTILLLEQSGFEVHWAEQARAALDRLRATEPVDVLFSDIALPDGMSGIELARQVRAEFPSVPILLTTGFAEGRARDGADEFPIITKPYRADDLRARLLALLTSAPSLADSDRAASG